MIQMCQLLKHITKNNSNYEIQSYIDVDVVPITIIFNMVCKLVISKIGGTYSIFRTLISTIVVKENII